MLEQKVKRATLADVARLAKVSPTSVSNVVNGRDGEMRPRTKKLILQAIEKLGYTPNLAARRLKTGHASAIGLIVPSVSYPFFGSFARLVEGVASTYGYHLLLANSDRNPGKERQIAKELLGYGVQGIIFGSSLLRLTHLEDLIKRGLHAVAFDRPTQGDDRIEIDSVGVDNIQVTRLLCTHLLSLGHRRIAFVSGPIQTVSRLERLAGYRTTLQAAGLEIEPKYIWEGISRNYGDSTAIELGRQGAHDLLTLPEPPTALIAINYHFAFGIYVGARDLGLKIPEDISVTGIDDTLLSEIIEPSLTTIQQPLEEIARLSVERLVSRLTGSYTGEPDHQCLSPGLVVRSSTGRCQGNG